MFDRSPAKIDRRIVRICGSLALALLATADCGGGGSSPDGSPGGGGAGGTGGVAPDAEAAWESDGASDQDLVQDTVDDATSADGAMGDDTSMADASDGDASTSLCALACAKAQACCVAVETNTAACTYTSDCEKAGAEADAVGRSCSSQVLALVAVLGAQAPAECK